MGGFQESLLYALYTALLAIFSPIILFAIFLRYPSTFFRSFRKGLSARLGCYDGFTIGKDEKPIWIHAASLGECRAALPLVRALRGERPALPILFTCTTENGIAEARRLGLGNLVLHAPLDLPVIVRRFLRKFHPRALLLLESELWPNCLRLARNSGLAVGVVNGRMSRRSSERYLRLRGLAALLMDKIDFLCAREAADAERFEKIGLERSKIHVTGNLKFDLLPWDLNGNAPAGTEAREFGEAPLLVAGSLREGEEEPVLRAFAALRRSHPRARLIFAPRHFERMDWIQSRIGAMNLEWALKSSAAPGQPWDVLLWDSFGDLWRAYQSGTAAFVGGSLVPKGGQNPIEPAWFSKPLIFGPSMENFAEPARLLLESGGALQVEDSDALARRLVEIFSDDARLARMGNEAKKAVDGLAGQATRRTMDVLRPYLRG